MKEASVKNCPTVFVAMSGGVDSSVAAALLKLGRFNVVGAYIKCFNVDGCSAADTEDARRVAEILNIPFYIFDLEKEYRKRVVRYMVDGYRRGITPNPDVMCNQEIKFGLFFKKALELGADYVATGHYIKIKKSKSLSRACRGIKNQNGGSKFKIKYKLLQARDKNKDQSYFLWTLTQRQLQRCLFPIGSYLKPKVRRLAKKFNLPTADKKDSQGICFLGRVPLKSFLRRYITPRPGIILDADSHRVIGSHQGAEFYTIGQRHGLDIKTDKKDSDGQPHYVVSKNTTDNTLVVAKGSNHPALRQKNIRLANINLIDPATCQAWPKKGLNLLARVRYRQPLARAYLKIKNRGKAGELTFIRPQKFVAPGQSAVFYSKKGEMLGGGSIELITRGIIEECKIQKSKCKINGRREPIATHRVFF